MIHLCQQPKSKWWISYCWFRRLCLLYGPRTFCKAQNAQKSNFARAFNQMSCWRPTSCCWSILISSFGSSVWYRSRLGWLILIGRRYRCCLDIFIRRGQLLSMIGRVGMCRWLCCGYGRSGSMIITSGVRDGGLGGARTGGLGSIATSLVSGGIQRASSWHISASTRCSLASVCHSMPFSTPALHSAPSTSSESSWACSASFVPILPTTNWNNLWMITKQESRMANQKSWSSRLDYGATRGIQITSVNSYSGSASPSSRCRQSTSTARSGFSSTMPATTRSLWSWTRSWCCASRREKRPSENIYERRRFAYLGGCWDLDVRQALIRKCDKSNWKIA